MPMVTGYKKNAGARAHNFCGNGGPVESCHLTLNLVYISISYLHYIMDLERAASISHIYGHPNHRTSCNQRNIFTYIQLTVKHINEPRVRSRPEIDLSNLVDIAITCIHRYINT